MGRYRRAGGGSAGRVPLGWLTRRSARPEASERDGRSAFTCASRERNLRRAESGQARAVARPPSALLSRRTLMVHSRSAAIAVPRPLICAGLLAAAWLMALAGCGRPPGAAAPETASAVESALVSSFPAMNLRG